MQMCIRGPPSKAFSWILESKQIVVLFRFITLRVEYWFDVNYGTHRINQTLAYFQQSNRVSFYLSCLFPLV